MTNSELTQHNIVWNDQYQKLERENNRLKKHTQCYKQCITELEKKLATQKQCTDCRDGEHDNYDNNVKLVTVREIGQGSFLKRGYICKSHRNMYTEDGYTVK